MYMQAWACGYHCSFLCFPLFLYIIYYIHQLPYKVDNRPNHIPKERVIMSEMRHDKNIDMDDAHACFISERGALT